MFLEILKFELKYRSTRAATYIYFILLFAIAFLFMNIAGEAFSNVTAIQGDKVFANSPYSIMTTLSGLSLLSLLVVSAIMGTPVYRDFAHSTHGLYYTTPISKFGYLGGRFVGSLIVSLFVLSGLGFGLWVATLMPYLNAEKLMQNEFMHYVYPYLLIIIPNTIFLGGIFFVLAASTRSIASTYLGGMVILVLYLAAGQLLDDIDNKMLASILDPFGLKSIDLETEYWTPADKNTLLIPLGLKILFNRLLWMGVGLAAFGFLYKSFSFSYFLSGKKRRNKKKIKDSIAEDFTPSLVLPNYTLRYTFADRLSQLFTQTKMELKGIVTSLYFILIMITGLVILFTTASSLASIYDTSTYPVTTVLAPALSSSFGLFTIIILILYSGELVWKERSAHFDQIYGAMPMPTWLPVVSKLLTLILLPLVINVVVLISGLLIQTFQGYFRYELGIYFTELFFVDWLDYIPLAVVAFLIQVLVNNKFLGYFVVIMFYVFTLFAGQMGIEHILLRFSSDPACGTST